MTEPKIRELDHQDWDQLLTIAAGFLPLTSGDLPAAMTRAIAAHAELIDAVRRGQITAELRRGSVRLEHHDGQLRLVYDRREVSDPGMRGEPSVPLLGFGEDIVRSRRK